MRSSSRSANVPAENNEMGGRIASILSGIVVGLLTGILASSFLMAATWSSIHGGMSGMMLAVLSLVAMAVPPGCGFLTGYAINAGGHGATHGTGQPRRLMRFV